MDIPLPQSENTSIYDLGFDQNLNTPTLTVATPAVYDSLDQTASQNITLGALYAGTNNKNIGIDPAQGIWLGNVKFASAPFSVTEAGLLTATGANITGTFTATTGSIGGWAVGTSALTSGSGSNSVGLDSGGVNPALYAGSATPASAPFRVTEAGVLTATAANITGTITANTGTIGGWTIGSTTLAATGATLDAGNQKLTLGTGNNVANLDAADATYRLAIGNSTYSSAPFRVDKAGAVTASNITITGGSVATSVLSGTVAQANLSIANQGWTQTSAFSVPSSTQVNWGAGTFRSSDGSTVLSISSGNTGAMAAKTYIYVDTAVSTTAYQITTTASTAVGAGKVLIAVAQNNTTEAIFTLMNDNQHNIDGANIVSASLTTNEIAANTIVAGNIAANTITAAKIAAATITTTEIAATTITGANINTLNITGKNATFDTGSIGGFTMASNMLSATNFQVVSGAANTANLNVGSGSNLAGLNSANGASDIAFWAGDTFANRAVAPFRVTAGGAVTATSATISGYVINGKGAFGGDGSDGALTISSGTTTIDCANAKIVIKNYTSISITGTGKLAFSNPNTNGTVIILKSQGAVTLTSSTAPMIDASAMGGAGGASNTSTAASSSNGNDGTDGYGFNYLTNHGTGGNSSSGSTGGALTSGFVFQFLTNPIVAKYPYSFIGAGGGSGAYHYGGGVTSSQTSGVGGIGGGGLIIECAGAWNFTTASGISVGGQNGGNAVISNNNVAASAGGGGGGGGICIVNYNSLTSNSGTIIVSGGTGGNSAQAGVSSANGGAGGGSYLNAGNNGTTTGSGQSGANGGNGSSLVSQNTAFA